MFEVRWEESASDELAAIWVLADSALRRRITEATHRAERQLERNPREAGDSRGDGRRILIESPLGITFRVEADGRTVSVLRVWCIQRPNA